MKFYNVLLSLVFAAFALQAIPANAMWNRFTTRFSAAKNMFNAHIGQKSAQRFTTQQEPKKGLLGRFANFYENHPFLTLFGIAGALPAYINGKEFAKETHYRYKEKVKDEKKAAQEVLDRQLYVATQQRDEQEIERLCKIANPYAELTFEGKIKDSSIRVAARQRMSDALDKFLKINPIKRFDDYCFNYSGQRRNALEDAARAGHIFTVKQLVPDSNWQAILEATERGDAHMVSCLASGYRLWKMDQSDTHLRESRYGRLPLHIAAEKGHIPVVYTLLGLGSEVDAKDSYSETAAHLAARNCNKRMLDVLKGAGANMQADNGGRQTSTPESIFKQCTKEELQKAEEQYTKTAKKIG